MALYFPVLSRPGSKNSAQSCHAQAIDLPPAGAFSISQRKRTSYHPGASCWYSCLPSASVLTHGRSVAHECNFLRAFGDASRLVKSFTHSASLIRCKTTNPPATGLPSSARAVSTLADVCSPSATETASKGNNTMPQGLILRNRLERMFIWSCLQPLSYAAGRHLNNARRVNWR